MRIDVPLAKYIDQRQAACLDSPFDCRKAWFDLAVFPTRENGARGFETLGQFRLRESRHPTSPPDHLSSSHAAMLA